MDLNKSGIYKITNTINDKCYIGSAVNIKNRWVQHIKHLNSDNHHSVYLQRAWNKDGKENFKFEILLICLKEELLIKEQSFLDWLNPEYNMCKIAGSSLGYKHTIHTRNKMSSSQKGRIISEETRNKISLANKGHNTSEETRLKISLSQKGKVISEETRLKQSIIKCGKKRTPHTKETKEKMSDSAKGRIRSKTTCLKLSIAGKNKKIPEEVRSKISLSVSMAKIGHFVSEETKRKISNTLRSKKSKFYLNSFEDIEWDANSSF